MKHLIRLIAVLVMLAGCNLDGTSSCGKKEKESEKRDPTADEIIRVIDKYHDTALAQEKASSRWADALDNCPTMDTVFAVAKINAVQIKTLSAKRGKKLRLKGICSSSAEVAFRSYIQAMGGKFGLWIQWLSKNETQLKKYWVKGKKYAIALERCLKKRKCTNPPAMHTGFGIVNSVDCTSVFECRIGASRANCSFGRIIGMILGYQGKMTKPSDHKLILKSTGAEFTLPN